MNDSECVDFLQWVLPRLNMRWPGFRKVRRQVCKRIDRRMRELDLSDARSYRCYLENHHEEWLVLDTMCRITISRFYRDRGVFDLLRDESLPRLAAAAQARGDRELRCWSAGCASAEEAYTLNIMWNQCLSYRFPDVRLHIVATDIDLHMLERAGHGCYPASSLKDLPPEWLTEAFVGSDNLYCIKDEFRLGIEFICQDIRVEAPPGPFDLILCRHLVFTYFDDNLQQKILDQLLAKLRSGGILVTGKQESLPIESISLQRCHPHMGIYRKKPEYFREERDFEPR